MTAQRPKVTVGIPVYNGAETIAATLRSVLSQDFDDFEVIVSDNASTDDTLAVVSAFDDPRVRVLTAQKNEGAGRNWNKVIEHASGEYIKVLSADDVLLPGALTHQAAALDAHDTAVLVTSKRQLIDGDGRSLGTRGPGKLTGLVAGTEVARRMVRTGTNLLGEPSATLVRMSALRTAGFFDEAAPYCVDMELWFRLLALGDVFVLSEPLVQYRVAAGSWTQDVLDRQASDVEDLLRSVTASRAFPVTENDLAAGIRGARRNAFLRRVLYLVLAVPSSHREKIAYLFAGGWNTLFGYIAFAALWALLGGRFSYALVLVLSYVVATLNAYLSYRVFVFRSTARVREELPRFLVVYGCTLVANLVAFPALVNWLDLNAYMAQAVFTIVVVAASYVGNRYFAFAESGE